MSVVGALLLGCAGPKESGDTGMPSDSDAGDETSSDFPLKDPSKPFALGEKGLVTLTNGEPLEITVQRDAGAPMFKFIMKKGGIADPEIQVAVQTIAPQMPEDLAATYVPIAEHALEMHVVGETGYGFMLRPKIEFYYTGEEIQAASGQGAAVEPLKGNLLILYMEQRADQWRPQKSVSLDEAANKITVSNVAGTGAWWLVAQKAQ
jgi:hypothetical protein